MGQVLQALAPTVLAGDLFFAHGSQDRYSIFSGLMAPLAQHFSWAGIQFFWLLVAQIASYCAIYALLKPSLDSGLRLWLGLLFAAGLSHGYEGRQVFSFSEDFLTARTLAEPLVLWALVALLRKRMMAAVLLVAAAALCHPLMSLPALVVGALYLMEHDRRWSCLLAFPALLPILALGGIAPFELMLKTYDSEWWRWIAEVNEVLVQRWAWVDWQFLAFEAAVLWIGARHLPSSLSRLCRSTLLAASLLLLLSAVGADILQNQLLTQLQLWRVLWLVRILVLACLPTLLLGLWFESDSSKRATARALVTLLLATLLVVEIRAEEGWVLMVVSAAGLFAWHKGLTLRLVLAYWVGLGSVLCIVMVCAGMFWNSFLPWPMGYLYQPDLPLWFDFLRLPAVLLSLPLLIWWGWQRGGWQRISSAAFFACMVLVCLPHWDRRSEWTRLLETGALQRTHPFQAWIAPGQSVYWHEQLAPTWLLLGRPSYYEKAQGAGLLFNEGTARAFGPRWDAWQPVRKHVQSCWMGAALSRSDSTLCLTPPLVLVQQLCSTQAELRYMVFDQALHSARGRMPALAVWNPQLPSFPDQRFYLYDCQQLV